MLFSFAENLDLPIHSAFYLSFIALRNAITSKTRVVILTNPHNPTGRIFSPETLQKLADLLAEKSKQNGRTIYIISDEAYSRFILRGNSFRSVLEFYPHSFLVYTFTKTLLNPGMRLKLSPMSCLTLRSIAGARMGYVAISPSINHKDQIRAALFTTLFTTSYAVPNNLIMYCVGEWEKERLMVSLPAIEVRSLRSLSTWSFLTNNAMLFHKGSTSKTYQCIK